MPRKQLVPLLAVGVVDHHDAGQAQPLRVLHVAIGSLGDGLAGVAVEHRLGIEGFQVADAAVHEQPDDALGAGREMRPAIGR